MNNTYNRLLDLVVEVRGTKDKSGVRSESAIVRAERKRKLTQERAEKAIRDARRKAGYTGDEVEPLSNRKDEGIIQNWKDRRDTKAEKRVQDKIGAAEARLQGITPKPKKSIRDRIKNAITRPVRNLKQGMNDLENQR
mgnify:CR=1 FL=1